MSHHSPTVRSGFQFSSSHALTSVRTSSGEGSRHGIGGYRSAWPTDMSDRGAPGVPDARAPAPPSWRSTRNERRAARRADLVRPRRRRRGVHDRRDDTVKGKAHPAATAASRCASTTSARRSRSSSIEGTATRQPRPRRDCCAWATELGGRYMGAERAERSAAATPYPASCSCASRATKIIAKARRSATDLSRGGRAPSPTGGRSPRGRRRTPPVAPSPRDAASSTSITCSRVVHVGLRDPSALNLSSSVRTSACGLVGDRVEDALERRPVGRRVEIAHDLARRRRAPRGSRARPATCEHDWLWKIVTSVIRSSYRRR